MKKKLSMVDLPVVFIAIPLLIASSYISGVEGTIGVNYGTVANNLPHPVRAAHFLLESTIINRVRIYDTNPDIIKAFAHTGIAVTVNIPNNQISSLAKLNNAKEWLKTNIVPHVPATNIVRILVGNEVVSTGDKLTVDNLVPAMQAIRTALVGVSLDRLIKVSTPHSLGILSTSSPPSAGKFRQEYENQFLKPILGFLKATGSPFLINPYPFFGCSKDTLDYALFRTNSKVLDENTKLTYTNMLDAQLDAVHSALKLIHFDDIEIVIAETGWPSKGEPGQLGVDVGTAAEYNTKLMQHVTSGVGTPLMPNRTFETYIFGLFNENLKPGPTSERNFGLFQPDMSPVYDIGILRKKANLNYPSSPTPVVVGVPIVPEPNRNSGRRWCLPKPEANDENLQKNIDYVCGLGIDCRPIQEGGACFFPDTVRAHAAYAMNAYYQATGGNGYDCDFAQTAVTTISNPSYGECIY
ncbi:glucan endo-1,3-beta-glucosidase-like isoform X2 [Apium graveolens]